MNALLEDLPTNSLQSSDYSLQPLVELVLAMSLGLVVCTAGLVFLIVTLHQSNAVGSRTVAATFWAAAVSQPD